MSEREKPSAEEVRRHWEVRHPGERWPDRVLSVRQPWAWLLMSGLKDVENRTWSTPFRGWFHVHAAKKDDPEAWAAARELCLRLTGLEIPEEIVRSMMGGYVGIIRLDDCKPGNESFSPWVDDDVVGAVAWEVSGATPYRFVPAKGRLGLRHSDGVPGE